MTPLYELTATQKLASESNTQVIYHGSSIAFDCPKCCRTARVDSSGTIAWEGEAVFATYDRRIALHYTVNKNVTGYNCGVDLITEITADKPLSLMLFGGTDKEDALNKLYGTIEASEPPGYLYQMNAKFFHHEMGLGAMERISKDPTKPGFLIKVEKINRRKEIEAHIKNGSIKIVWFPFSNIPALNISNENKKENKEKKKARCCCY